LAGFGVRCITAVHSISPCSFNEFQVTRRFELFLVTIDYIDPTSFTVDESIFILSIVIIGGVRSFWGTVLAAAFLVLLPEALRFVGMPNAIAANMRQIIYGGILIYMMFQYSKGFGHHSSERRKKPIPQTP